MFPKLTSAADNMTIAPGMVMISLSAIALGAAFGGYLPLIALWMETLEVSFQQIGIISGTSALGIICSAYFAPQLAQKYGYVEIGRAHVRTPVTSLSRMPSSA